MVPRVNDIDWIAHNGERARAARLGLIFDDAMSEAAGLAFDDDADREVFLSVRGEDARLPFLEVGPGYPQGRCGRSDQVVFDALAELEKFGPNLTAPTCGQLSSRKHQIKFVAGFQ